MILLPFLRYSLCLLNLSIHPNKTSGLGKKISKIGKIQAFFGLGSSLYLAVNRLVKNPKCILCAHVMRDCGVVDKQLSSPCKPGVAGSIPVSPTTFVNLLVGC